MTDSSPVTPTIALYCRVSTDEQAQHGYSIENQRHRLVAYCESQGWDNYQLYVDDGYTGTNLDRPALKRLLQHVHRGLISTVVVYKLDRLSRKQLDVLHLLEDEFEAHGVAFKSSTEPFDTATALGKAMLGILAVFAQLERDTIVERLSTGLRQRVQAGKWSGGRVPFGYTYNGSTGKLEQNPRQADLVRELFQRYIRGANLSDLATWVSLQTDERVFDHGIIRDMLKRRVYLGEVGFGNTLSDGIAKPIIDQATFDAVQTEMRRRVHGRNPIGQYLLTGLLYCGLCGESFIHVVRRSGRGKRHTYNFYACKNQHHRPKGASHRPCKVGYRNQEKLEAWVISQLHAVCLDPTEVAGLQQTDDASEKAKQASMLRRLELDLRKFDSRLEKWYAAFEDGTLEASKLKSRVDRLELQKRVALERLEALKHRQLAVSKDAIRDVHHLISDAWDYMTFAEQREVLRAAVNKVVVPPKEQEPQIVWNT